MRPFRVILVVTAVLGVLFFVKANSETVSFNETAALVASDSGTFAIEEPDMTQATFSDGAIFVAVILVGFIVIQLLVGINNFYKWFLKDKDNL